MNLVQLAEHAKNLSNQQLQQMLQQPDGAVPPFILAAEAARRQDIERSAQMQPSEPTTVLDDLVQSRAVAAGVNTLPAQMAQPQQPQMAHGGQVRRFAGGALATGTTSPVFVTPEGGASTLSDIGNWIGDRWEAFTSPVSPFGVSGATDPIVRQNAGLDPVVPPGGIAELSGEGSKPQSSLDQMERRGVNRQIADEEARAKEAANANKQAQMGNPQGPPTTENSADADEHRRRLEEIMKVEEQQRLLGISSSGYADAAVALADNTPGRTSAQRWAAVAAALAKDREGYSAERAAAEKEGAMALLKWDVAAQEAADQKAAAAAQAESEAYKFMSTEARQSAGEVRQAINDIYKKYGADPNAALAAALGGDSSGLGTKEMSEEDAAKVERYTQMYTQMLGQARGAAEKYGNANGVTSVPVWDWTQGKVVGLE